jgi:hypothetical protein
VGISLFAVVANFVVIRLFEFQHEY